MSMLGRLLGNLRSKIGTPAADDARTTDLPFDGFPMYVPPGHFYSPLPSPDYVKANRERIFPPLRKEIPGVDLREEEQLKLLNALRSHYDTQPFEAQKQAGLRYCFENPSYSYLDGIFLHSMIREFRPRRIVEIGSGFSTCVILDTRELFFPDAIDVTCIEPYPDLLGSLLKDGDRDGITIIDKDLQEVPLSLFLALKENDILLIDSTHVSKVGSDVNYAFFEILPSLAPGVLIHIHDVFFPFEYPYPWVMENRGWNELYLLRAFLQFNSEFEIMLFSSYLISFFEDYFEKEMPLCLRNSGGNIWLRRLPRTSTRTKNP